MKKQILFLASFLVLFFTACEQETLINPVDDIVQENTIELQEDKQLQEVLEQIEDRIASQEGGIESRGCNFSHAAAGYSVRENSSNWDEIRLWARNNSFPPANQITDYFYYVNVQRYNLSTGKWQSIGWSAKLVKNTRTLLKDVGPFHLPNQASHRAYIYIDVINECGSPQTLMNKTVYL